MPLRCLLFATDEDMVQPIRQVLADLGVEGELCQSAVDAVEKITTQLFQIVVTDWEDQPEASFLLQTARDQKAANRPLTLAIVGDESRVPEALRAGANSVLLKPLRAEQVRDTIKTACELLRTKQTSSAPAAAPLQTTVFSGQPPSARAGASVSHAKAPDTTFFPRKTEKNFRAGEFLQSSRSAPGAQFDTESDIQKSIAEADTPAIEVDALTELEPMAAQLSGAAAPAPARRENREALTGWAAVQSRLTRPIPQNSLQAEAPEAAPETAETFDSLATAAQKQKVEESRSEAALHAYMAGEPDGVETAAGAHRPARRTLLLFGAICLLVAVLVVIPQTRLQLQLIRRKAATAALNWLNPRPAPLQQVPVQHDSFGQDGDEYKLPVAGNIPDATTDPSQIRVVPIIDPTKAGKNSDSGDAQTAAADSPAPDASQPATDSNGQPQAGATDLGPQTAVQAEKPPGTIAPSLVQAPALVQTPAQTAPVSAASPQRTQPEPAQPRSPAVQTAALPGANAPAAAIPIPSSLKSQLGSMTPEASGTKPIEAAMSSIEPVVLPEAMARGLLAEMVTPQYPAGAKASGQSGSVVLQVLIARDGTVQDAKFLQGSLMFANAAIDAVKQWHFKPYLLNGRPVSVQSTITLSFKPA
jgi:periplasmic protein TonB